MLFVSFFSVSLFLYLVCDIYFYFLFLIRIVLDHCYLFRSFILFKVSNEIYGLLSFILIPITSIRILHFTAVLYLSQTSSHFRQVSHSFWFLLASGVSHSPVMLQYCLIVYAFKNKFSYVYFFNGRSFYTTIWGTV